MSKGKLFEALDKEYRSEFGLNVAMEKRLKESREEFLKIDPATDDALLDSIYDWFLKYFGEVK